MSSEVRSRESGPSLEGVEQAVLIVQGGPSHGAIKPLPSGVVTLGRQSDNFVVIDEAVVSRRHAAIVERGGAYYLRDLGSTNGTFINRQKIGEGEHLLKHNDTIRLGGSQVSLTFRHTGAPTLRISAIQPAPEPIVVDTRGRQVYLRGQLLAPPLARKEFDLLALLYSRRGEAIGRDEIARYVWPERPEGEVGEYEIEQCVHRLRSRIEEDKSTPKLLVTVRGFGYKLA